MKSDPTACSAFRKITIPVCLVSLSLALSLALGEILLRIRTPSNVYEWTRNVVQQEISIPSDFLGYISRPNSNVTFQNKEFNTTVIINSRSMRDQEYSYTNPEGRYRIVVLGDSFSFGWGVEAKDSVAEILENEFLRDVQVINMSVPGYNTLQEVLLFQSEGKKYKPNLVMVFWFINDIENSIPRPFFKSGKMYFFEPGNLYQKIHFFLMKKSYLYCFLRLAIHNLRHSKPSNGEVAVPEGSDEDWRVEAELLKELKQETDKLDASLFIIYVPIKNYFVAQHKLGEIAESLETKILDLGEQFFSLTPSERNKIYFTTDDHWTPHGHRYVAGLIANYLKLNADIFGISQSEISGP